MAEKIIMEGSLKFIILLIFSYLVGSINFARIFSKLKQIELPKGLNPGAATVFMNISKRAGIFTALADAGKGILPVVVAKWYLKNSIFSGPTFWAMIALMAIIGHCYPIFYNFIGGRGLATSAGFIFSFFPYQVLSILPLYLFLIFYYKENLSLAALICIPLIFFAIVFSSGWLELFNFLPGFFIVLLFMFFRNYDRAKDLKERLAFILNKE